MEWRSWTSIAVMLLVELVALGNAQWHVKRIKERDLQVITLYEGVYTMSRRTQPVPQLRCLSGCWRTPTTVQCYNRGWDGYGNNWECKAELPKGVHFGQLEVNCEGYDYPDDPFITAGSCALSYRLVGRDMRPYYSGASYYRNETTALFNMFFQVVVIVTVLIFICACCMPWGEVR